MVCPVSSGHGLGLARGSLCFVIRRQSVADDNRLSLLDWHPQVCLVSYWSKLYIFGYPQHRIRAVNEHLDVIKCLILTCWSEHFLCDTKTITARSLWEQEKAVKARPTDATLLNFKSIKKTLISIRGNVIQDSKVCFSCKLSCGILFMNFVLLWECFFRLLHNNVLRQNFFLIET